MMKNFSAEGHQDLLPMVNSSLTSTMATIANFPASQKAHSGTKLMLTRISRSLRRYLEDMR